MEHIQNAPASDLTKRVLSAALLAPLVLGAVWLGGLAFNVLIGVAIILMAYEWARVTCGPDWLMDAVLISVTAIAAVLAVHWQIATVNKGMVLFGAGGIIAAGLALAFWLGRNKGRELRWPLLGIPYIALGSVAMVWLRGLPDLGLALIIWLLLIVWSMDIGAYFAGRAIGGPKLAPRASPNKTWAGLLGGMLSAGLVGGVTAAAAGLGQVLALSALSAAIGGWAQLGDIAESMVKRHFGVKDMSNLIPGHGGILDRVDGLLFAAPLMIPIALLIGSK
ncbi:MAG TPA: phosphatidate cytidylyltransferase [Alphaproteobacteria bacterium]|nr:phosphatidate cytidylyltransferase [Alphaproteobacteria bacterium]